MRTLLVALAFALIACGMTGGPLTCTATVSGLYTLLVRDPLPGSSGVALQRLQNPVGCTELLSGYGPHTREIPAAGGTRCFRVTEDSNAILRVRVIPVSGTLIPTAEVLRPDGTTRCGATAADDSTCWFDVSGRHTILVRDGGQSGTGSFTIALQRLDAPSGCSMHSFGTLPASNLLSPATSSATATPPWPATRCGSASGRAAPRRACAPPSR